MIDTLDNEYKGDSLTLIKRGDILDYLVEKMEVTRMQVLECCCFQEESLLEKVLELSKSEI